MAKPSPMARVLLLAIGFYQATLSPLIGGHCRFQPTCSRYAAEAVQRFGAFRGTVLAVRRLSRCHPCGSAGYDPVPEPRQGAGPRRTEP